MRYEYDHYAVYISSQMRHDDRMNWEWTKNVQSAFTKCTLATALTKMTA